MEESGNGSESTVRRQVVAASVWVTAGMLLGRLAGIVREFLIADTFGVTRNADVAILLVTGPEVLVTIAGSGAVGLVLIPILLDHDVGAQMKLVRRLTLWLGLAAILLAILAGLVVSVAASSWATAGGLAEGTFRTAVVVTAFAVPSSMLVVVTAAFLRAQDRFAAVSLATVTFTAPVLVAIVVFRSVLGVAIGIAVGGTLRYLIQAVIIWRGWGGSNRRDDSAALPGVRRTDVATSFGISVVQAAQVSLPILLVAALGGEGDVALLNYGWRVLLIPIGLLASVFSVAAYPTIVRLVQQPGRAGEHAISAILQPIILLSLIVGTWLWINAPEAIDVVYRPADLDGPSLSSIASEIRAGAASIPLITIGTAATTVLFGMKRSRSGLIPYVLATVVLLVGGSVLYRLDGTIGVMYAATAYGLVLAGAGAVALRQVSGYAIVSTQVIVVAIAVVAGSSLIAYSIRAVVSAETAFGLIAGGVAYVVVLAGGYALFTLGRSRRGTPQAT